MNKYKKVVNNNWSTKEQVDYIMNCPQKLLPQIQLHELKSEIKFYYALKKDNFQVLNTINLFDSNAQKDGHEFTFLKKIKRPLQSIKNSDIIFNFEGNNYLYHTYKVLGFIRESVNAYLLSKDNTFLKGTIGSFDRKKQSYLLEYQKHKKRLFEPLNTSRGSNLVNAFLYRNLYLREKFTKQFLSFYALIGIDNIKLFDNSSFESAMLKKTLKVFMSGKINKDDCANSLLSVLYYYLQFHMKLKKAHALKVAKELVYDVFNVYTEYKGSEILKNIHVNEVIGSHIVYGFNTKKKIISDSQKSYLQSIMLNNTELTEVDTRKFPSHIIKSSIDNPLRLYTLLTPSELLQEMK